MERSVYERRRGRGLLLLAAAAWAAIALGGLAARADEALGGGAAAGADREADRAEPDASPVEHAGDADEDGDADAEAESGADSGDDADSSEGFWLPETVVTAARGEREALLVPFSVTGIDLGGGRRGLGRTTAESLELLPGVHVQKTGPGQSSPFIRGLTGFHTLILVDGIRLNNSVFRGGPNQYAETIDIFLADRIELVRGPHAVLYGSDAVGGTINILTQDPPLDPLKPFGGRLLYRYASGERSHTGRAEAWTGTETFGARVGVSVKRYGDIEAAKLGRLPDTGYDQEDLDGKVVWAPSDALRFTVAGQYTRIEDAPRTHRTVFAVPYRGNTTGDERRRDLDQERLLAYVAADVGDIGVLDSARVFASYQRQEERQIRERDDGRIDRQEFTVNTLGLGLQLERETPIGRLTFGAEHYHDQVNSGLKDFAADGTLTGTAIQGGVGDDASYDLLGVYLQDEIAFGDLLDVVLGGRYTYAKAHVGDVEDPNTGEEISTGGDWDAIVGSVRAMLHLGDHLHPFVGLSQGFRAPNVSDLSRLGTARSGQFVVPSLDVDPEYFTSLDVGAKIELGTFRGQATWFYTWIRDVITRRATGATIDGNQVFASDNAGDGFTTGVELEAVWEPLPERFPHVEVFGGFFWMDGKLDVFSSSGTGREREVLSRLTPWHLIAGVRWRSPDGRFFLEASARVVGHQHRLSSGDEGDTQRIPPGGSHGYAVLGIRGSAQVHDNVRVFGAVENLGDRAYRVHGSGVNAPGINAVVGLELRY